MGSKTMKDGAYFSPIEAHQARGGSVNRYRIAAGEQEPRRKRARRHRSVPLTRYDAVDHGQIPSQTVRVDFSSRIGIEKDPI